MLAVKLLSNGNYHVMLTSAGGGYSCWKGLAVTRWHEDAVLDNWGGFCYLRDCATGSVWSSTLQPTLQRPEACQASFSAGSASFLCQNHEIETHTEIAVSLDDDLESCLQQTLCRNQDRPGASCGSSDPTTGCT